jgi:hypothetical protein
MIQCNIEQEQTKILDDNGAFFAFNNEQMDKYADQSLSYKSVGGGLYCPENNVDGLARQLADSHAFKIKWELDNNTLKDIIWYQLSNHETQITGDIDDAISALTPYKISDDDVRREYKDYYQHCIDNDYF